MARLCVRIKENLHPTNPALNDLRTQIGDVVCIVEDSHQFSHAELSCGHYEIIDMPGVPAVDLAYLTEPSLMKVGVGEEEVEVLLKKRKVTLDLTGMKQASPKTKSALDTYVSIKV